MPCWTKKPNQEPEPNCPDVVRQPKPAPKPVPEREKELVPA